MTGLNIKTVSHVTVQIFDHSASKGIMAVLLYISAYLFKTHENFVSIVLPLFLIVAIDTLTGVACAIKSRDLSSKGFSGLGVKLFAYTIYICTARVIDAEAGTLSLFGTVLINDGMTIVFKAFIIGTESISIFENLGKLGFPIPNYIKKYFKNFTDDGQLKTDHNKASDINAPQ